MRSGLQMQCESECRGCGVSTPLVAWIPRIVDTACVVCGEGLTFRWHFTHLARSLTSALDARFRLGILEHAPPGSALSA